LDNRFFDTKILETMIKNCGDESELKKLLGSKRVIKIGYYIDDILRKKNLSKSEVLRKANLEESYGYQLLRGGRKLPRDRVIQLSIAMGLNLEETNDFLKQAQHQPLYPKTRENRDAVIIYCIQKKRDLIETELILEEFKEKSLQNFRECEV
jgi:transcriptional regulator with XRE-family HTH domain